ncbi:ORF6N domain-containing protein [Treponema phagedenis]|uniref:KilA-N DNA-binding domain-containing protein n=1 Tax=Treponema phagedenis TaxID=162 RepID=A0A0B7GW24_TREPH|nr:ORF6N domain-containing protein [Treponema phagedenis]QSH95635.1 ORF6N domain-containing protein [Treponema phagedenis]QSH98794.1 ORF6N domain-containing protein [Treponema phagedenis]CEM62874.1 conserved hypothetical protein [Treponema phagedenis]
MDKNKKAKIKTDNTLARVKESTKKSEQQILLVNTSTIRSKIYIIRGEKVMLDYELAEIYGYETKNFNRQVKNNIDKFDGDDFMFQLTKEEIEILRCKNCTSSLSENAKNFTEKFNIENTDLKSKNSSSSWGGKRYLPYAFTEQGIYHKVIDKLRLNPALNLV